MTAQALHAAPTPAGRPGALLVPVSLPGDADPAALSSAVDAIEKALLLVLHADQG